MRAVAAALLVAAAAGCAGPAASAPPAPVGFSPGLAGLRVRVRRAPTSLDQEVGAALETELARGGAAVAIDDRAPADAEVKVSLDLRAVGPVVEGIATATVERDGALIDRVSSALDVYRRDRFAALVARQLAEALARSPRVAGLASGPPGGVIAPPAAPPPIAAPPPPPSAAPPAIAAPLPPAGPPSLGRSGRFGMGFGVELQIGWAQVFAPGDSPAGVHLALGAQIDMGPRAAVRLPLAIVAAGSGTGSFAEASFVPTYIYRFRNQADQTLVPYVGLGVKLAFVDAGRQLLGRPDTGVKSPDSCTRRHSVDTSEDCAFTVSPEPTAGFEWHANRLFALDVAGAYSFAHLTSSAGLVSWIHVVSVYVGPRLSF